MDKNIENVTGKQSLKEYLIKKFENVELTIDDIIQIKNILREVFPNKLKNELETGATMDNLSFLDKQYAEKCRLLELTMTPEQQQLFYEIELIIEKINDKAIEVAKELNL